MSLKIKQPDRCLISVYANSIVFTLRPFGVEWSPVAGHTTGHYSRVAITEVRRRGLDQRSPCASSACLRAG